MTSDSESCHINLGMMLTVHICCCSRTKIQMLEQLKHGQHMHRHVALMDHHCVLVLTNTLSSSITTLLVVQQMFSSLQSQSSLNSWKCFCRKNCIVSVQPLSNLVMWDCRLVIYGFAVRTSPRVCQLMHANFCHGLLQTWLQQLSLHYNFPNFQINQLQHAVVKTSKSPSGLKLMNARPVTTNKLFENHQSPISVCLKHRPVPVSGINLLNCQPHLNQLFSLAISLTL